MKTTTRYYLKALAFCFVGAGLIHITLALLRAWRFDWQRPIEIRLANIAISTLVGVGLVHCLRAGYFHAAWRFIRKQSPKEVARACVRFVLGHPMLVLALVLALLLERSAPPVESLSSVGQAIHSAAHTFGLLALVVWMLWRSATEMSSVSVGHVGMLAVAVVERFVLISGGLIAIRAFAPELAELVAAIKQNPDSSLASAMGILVVCVAFGLAPKRSLQATRDAYPTGGAAYGLAARRSPRQPYDIHRTAIHEAGHLLLFSALPSLPVDLSVRILREIGPIDEYRGQVVAAQVEPDVFTEGFLRWSMLMHLSGSAAEAAMLGDRADGAEGDNHKWLSKATHFLRAGLGEVFYAAPADDTQISHNRAVLNGLRAAQQAALGAFFEVNRGLLSELAARIGDRLELNRDELGPFLERVTFTADIAPLPQDPSGDQPMPGGDSR